MKRPVVEITLSQVEARALVKRASEGIAASFGRASGSGGGYSTNRPALSALAKIAEVMAR